MSTAPPSSRGQSFSDRVVGFVAGPPGWLAKAKVTRAIVWASVAVFAAELLYARAIGVFPALSSRVLIAFGANYAVATVQERRVEALVASCFVHGSLLHLFMNLFVLRHVGPLVERLAGSARIGPLYLVAGVCGSVASAASGYVADTQQVSVGASGAIFGVMTAAIVAAWRTYGWKNPISITVFRWVVFFFVFGLLASFRGKAPDGAAHAGGAIAGAIVAASWRRSYVYSARGRSIAIAASALVVAASGLAAAARAFADPYAPLLVSERVELARRALGAGDCFVAWGAARAAARLDPRAPDVVFIVRAIGSTCGR